MEHKMEHKNDAKKYLTYCFHGLTVVYPQGTTKTSPAHTLCGHPQALLEKRWTLKDVIAWVEQVKQPQWKKFFSFFKFQIFIVKYW